MSPLSFSSASQRAAAMDQRAMAQHIEVMKREAIESLNQTKKVLQSTETIAEHSNAMLDEQTERLVKVDAKVEVVGAGLEKANEILKKMRLFRSPFGFTGNAKKYAYIFESKYGVADWSGPLRKRRRFYPMYRERFVALFKRTLYCYTDSSHLMVETDVITLENAQVEGNAEKLRITISVADSKKHVFKCANENEYKGWMLALNPESPMRDRRPTLERKQLYYSLDYKVDEDATPQQTGKEQTSETETNVDPFDKAVDSKLDELHQHLNNLGIASQQIGQRIQEQARMLDGLDSAVDKQTDNMQNSLTKMKRV